MTDSEAIEKLKNMRLFMQIEDKNNGCKFTEDDYKANEMAIQALEKQIPKKPMISYDERVKENWCSCSVCAFGFGWKRTIHYKYCPDCGQKLDWSNENGFLRMAN